MAKQKKTKGELRGKPRMRAEIVEAAQGLHKIGAISNAVVQKTKSRMARKRVFNQNTCSAAASIRSFNTG